MDIYYVNHDIIHYAGVSQDIHLGVEHQIAPLLHLLGADRAEQLEQPLVGRKPHLVSSLFLDFNLRIDADVGPERGDCRVGTHAVLEHVRQYGCHMERAEYCVFFA